ncbi:MAG: hypothetical protein KGH57_03090 [Candidatus Micrarchaeota archaeon]|nr:hypothetical protein [Candidatus Micrarchaeota archaeon]
MRRDEKLRNMLKHHVEMAERLKNVDLSKLSEKQLEKLEKTLEELESYVLVHMKAKQ